MTDFRRIVVPESARPLITPLVLLVLVLVALVAVWLRQTVQPDRRPTMRVVQEAPLRVVDIPPGFVSPRAVPPPAPVVPVGATPEQWERALRETDEHSDPPHPAAPDINPDER